MSTNQVMSTAVGLTVAVLDNTSSLMVEGSNDSLTLSLVAGLISVKPGLLDSARLDEYERAVEICEGFIGETYRSWRKQITETRATIDVTKMLLQETSGIEAFRKALEEKRTSETDETDAQKYEISFRLVDYCFDRALWLWLIPQVVPYFQHATQRQIAGDLTKWIEDEDPLLLSGIDFVANSKELPKAGKVNLPFALHATKKIQMAGFHNGITSQLEKALGCMDGDTLS